MEMTPTQSESVAELTKALAKAQGEIENVMKASINPHFKSAYADLAAVRGAIYEALSANGICITQPVVFDDGKVIVITEVALGDQWKRAPLALPLQQQSAQPMGSLISYLRRYGMSSMLCLAAEDDDGNAATASANGSKSAPGVTGPISLGQAEEIRQAIVEVAADLPRFLRTFGIEKIQDMPAGRFADAMRMLELKRQSLDRIKGTQGMPVDGTDA